MKKKEGKIGTQEKDKQNEGGGKVSNNKVGLNGHFVLLFLIDICVAL